MGNIDSLSESEKPGREHDKYSTRPIQPEVSLHGDVGDSTPFVGSKEAVDKDKTSIQNRNPHDAIVGNKVEQPGGSDQHSSPDIVKCTMGTGAYALHFYLLINGSLNSNSSRTGFLLNQLSSEPHSDSAHCIS